MSEKVKNPKPKKQKGVWYTDIKHGEVYEATKEWEYAVYQEKYKGKKELTVVPAGQRLIFRSLQAYKKEKQLALFVWLEKRMTICLVCSGDAGLIYIKHVPWEERNQ